KLGQRQFSRDRTRLLLTYGLDFQSLPLEIDSVFCFGGEVLPRPDAELSQFRPDPVEKLEADLRVAEQIEGSASHAVLPQMETEALRLMRRERELVRQTQQGLVFRDLVLETHLPLPPDNARRNALRRQP